MMTTYRMWVQHELAKAMQKKQMYREIYRISDDDRYATYTQRAEYMERAMLAAQEQSNVYARARLAMQSQMAEIAQQAERIRENDEDPDNALDKVLDILLHCTCPKISETV